MVLATVNVFDGNSKLANFGLFFIDGNWGGYLVEHVSYERLSDPELPIVVDTTDY
jgi:hypothetical protein